MQCFFSKKWLWILVSVIATLDAKEKPKGVAKILDFKECDTTAENPFKIEDLYLDSVDQGYKKFTGTIHLPRPINEEMYYTVKVEQYKNGDWDFVIEREGQACDLMDEYAGEAWDVIRASAEPPVPDKCDVAAGIYKLKNLEITRDQFKPDAVYGTLRVMVRLYENKDTEEYFACAMVTLEIFQRTPAMSGR